MITKRPKLFGPDGSLPDEPKRQGLRRRTIQVSAVIDIEAENWDTFVLGGILHSDGTYRRFWGDKEAHFVEEILSVKGTVWAHFGGGYDYKWLLDWCLPDEIETLITPAGTRIVSMQVGDTRFCDSFALVPMKLEKFTESQGVKKKKLELPCRCGRGCGGMCSIKRNGMPLHEKKQLEIYLEADCKSLWQGLDNLSAFAHEHNLDLGPTLGGSSWRNLRRTVIGIGDASLQRPEYHFARSGYAGGRTQVYNHNLIPDLYHSDIASEYPWAMQSFSFPAGDPVFRKGDAARRLYAAGKEGIYKAVVETPECLLPPLPVRAKSGSLSFPWGQYTGNWTAPELRYAEECGSTVKILEGLIYPESDDFFSGWVDRLWNLRKKVGKDTTLGKWLKLYLNSVSGKFGMHPFRDEFTLNLKGRPKPCECVCRFCYRKPPCRHMAKCECGAPMMITDNIWHSTKYHMREPYYVGDNCAHIEWASYITSYGRIELGRTQRTLPHGSVLYSDTDSIFSLHPIIRRPGNAEDPNLGEWIISRVKNFQAIAPKVYFYEDAAGKLDVKAKGVKIPKGELPIIGKVYDSGGGVYGIKRGVREGKFFVRNEIQRRLSLRSGDRVMLPDGTTRAPHAREILE